VAGKRATVSFVTSQPEIGGTGGLDFAIDRRAEVPIGVQLAWALRARIGDGRLAPAQRLPGLRDLAQALKINANTVRAVYQRLEHEGLIESQQGSGTFVASTAHRRSAAGAIAASAAREARQTGVDPREVAAALYVDPEQQTSSPERGAERRRALRLQIATLEQVLVKLEAGHPELAHAARVATPPQRTLPARGPRLLDVEELEQTQTHLIRRLAALQSEIDAQAQQAQRQPAKARRQTADEPEQATEQARSAGAPKRASRARAKTRPAPAGA
jgi:DNA-binding transcriptional regulator YhcF (GntR family)